uniref:Uncharacterized protein n=1 Tax=Trichuris muris TaxID=70415 RepID=A0A5S6PYN7_TRIMR
MSSPSGARPADVAIETKSIDESSSATLDWRKCVNNSGQLYNFNDSTDMSQRKRSAEMGHVSRKHDKGKRRPSCTEHAGSVRSPAGSSGVQESGGPEREKRTQSLSTPDSLAGRENLASTLVNMALQSKLDLHAPDVLSRAISLLGKEHGESCGGVSLGTASACTSEERSVGCSDSLFSQKVQSGSTHQLPSGVDRKEKDPTPHAESLKSQPSMADKPTSCSGQPQNEKLLAHLLTKRPVLNSILDVDDNVQVSEVLRNVLNEESTPYIKEALACLAPSSMLSEADHLYVERQRTNVQLVANRVKMWQVKQKQRSLFAQVAVLKEKIACADFAAALRKRRKENPKTP